MTHRPLAQFVPPDEEWVIVGYRTRPDAKEYREIRVPWMVLQKTEPSGRSVHTRQIQKLRKSLAPQADDNSFRARVVTTPHGKFGYLRIFTFENSVVDKLVAEIERLPQNGLIIDIRENNGGRTVTAEQLLQVVSPNYPKNTIEPERFCFINTHHVLQLCNLQESNLTLGPAGLQPWIESIKRAMVTGSPYSASFCYTDPKSCNDERRFHYPGPVIVITDGLTCSAAEMFAAGFQDHGGKLLGLDEMTAGAGANARTHTEIKGYFEKAEHSPFQSLPKKADFKIAFRRCQRVGQQAGNEIEDFGVGRDYGYRMTCKDLLNGNVDLINEAARLLVSKEFSLPRAIDQGR